MLNISALSLRGLAVALALTVGLAAVGDASAMSRKDKRTVVGAVVGGVAGHLLSNGDTAATVGGAVGRRRHRQPDHPRQARPPVRPWLRQPPL